MNKYKYIIYPDRVYVLEYEDMKIEVQGSDIFDRFRRQAFLDKIIDELNEYPDEYADENLVFEAPETPKLKKLLTTYPQVYPQIDLTENDSK